MENREEKKEEAIGKREETSVGYTRDVAPQTFEDGFTWYSVAGAFFVGFLMMPASIYLGLLIGAGIGSAAQWVTIILFMEMVRRSFGVMKKQEIFILYYIAGGLVGGGPFGGFIWNQYLLQSPVASGFRLVEYLKAEGVRWIAPFPGSEAYALRTFLHKDWMQPILLMFACSVLGALNWFGGGYFVYRLTSDLERLPFPMAPVAAQGAIALADASGGKRETWRWNVFSIGAMLGVTFGLIYVFIPAFSTALFNRTFQILPIPFIELTTNVEGILPSAIWGLNTDLGGILAGFVIPFPIIIGQFITVMFSQTFLHPFLYRMGVFPTWRHGMGSIQTGIATNINFWMSFGIGSALVIAGIGIATTIRSFAGKEKRIRGTLKPVPGRGDIPLWIAGLLWVGSMCGFIYLSNRLVPAFPLFFLIFFAFVWSPLDTYVSARMRGLTGGDWSVPYIREGIFVFSRKLGYQGVAIWFAPIPLSDHGWMSQFFREVELTGTKFTSIIKAEILKFPIVMVTSFIFWSLMWKLGPIPSAIYPFAAKYWPLNATTQCLWSTATVEGRSWLLESIKLKYIIWGGATVSGLLALVHYLKLPMLFFYGLVGGFGGWPHGALPLMFGGLLSRYVFVRRFGAETWRSYAPVLLAGYYCGMGLIGMAGIAVAFISKSVYQMPF